MFQRFSFVLALFAVVITTGCATDTYRDDQKPRKTWATTAPGNEIPSDQMVMTGHEPKSDNNSVAADQTLETVNRFQAAARMRAQREPAVRRYSNASNAQSDSLSPGSAVLPSYRPKPPIPAKTTDSSVMITPLEVARGEKPAADMKSITDDGSVQIGNLESARESGKAVTNDPSIHINVNAKPMRPSRQPDAIVFFGHGDTSLSPTAQAILRDMMKDIGDAPAKISVFGYASQRANAKDSKRRKEINLKYSRLRADRVSDFVARMIKSDNQVIEKAFGEDGQTPNFDGMSKEQLRRRVDIFVAK